MLAFPIIKSTKELIFNGIMLVNLVHCQYYDN